MRSIRTLAMLACTLIGVALSAPVATAASTPIPIHLIKDCSTFTGDTPSLCTIAVSDLGAIPIGAKVWYQGPVVNNVYFLSSNVLIDAGAGTTATGYCIFDARAVGQTGLCTFWSGTGVLTGFTAILHVTIDATGEWHLDGEYYFDPAAATQRANALGARWRAS